ncbi:MAG: 4Fe-4S cluster-binding domain-containing protein [Cellulosilyticaceae bacterium]
MIAYKDIEHENLGDAPFIGARLLSAQCSRNCKNCFNQSLKDEPTKYATEIQIISMVLSDKLNEGIIFGGLEWTEQPWDLIVLVRLALLNKLQVMIYTGTTEKEFIKRVPQLKDLPIWCKFGHYDETQKVAEYISNGIKLASANQYIKFMKN